MMVQPTQDEGVDSGIPADSLQTPIITQPSSSRTQKKQSRRKQRKDNAVAQEEFNKMNSVPTLPKLYLLERKKDAPSKEIVDLKKRSRRVGKEKEIKNYRIEKTKESWSIEDIDKDADISLVDETQGRSDDADMFDTDDLHGDK
ncbi:hypothetical protein Tco_1137712 [Tanacetum coccineum]|uniref:Uncharacterized protein n=1 Tax=Tanacetum coccineum TaxID=301880 RepID=A0ABQ5E315_9ASTR